MTGLGIALLVLGYGLFYYGENNLISGGAGPTFAATFNLKSPLQTEGVGNVLSAPNGSSNQTGQAPAVADSPGQAVRTT